MMEAHPITAAEMRRLEAAAMASGAVTGLDLMERAGAGVVDAILAEWPDLAQGSHRAVVLCGPGNNGGDGFVIARLLQLRDWDIHVFFFGTADKLPSDARTNYDRLPEETHLHALGYPQVTAHGAARFGDVASHRYDIAAQQQDAPFPPFLIVDALFGIGLTRPLSGLGMIPDHWDYLTTFRDLNNTRVVAVDVPSGIETDSGAILHSKDTPFSVLCADLTVTFHRPKPCHFHQTAADICGKVAVADIGL